MTPKQTLALDTIDDSSVEDLVYGGAKGGGKSIFGCYYSFLYAQAIIDLCQIEPTDNPIPIGFLGRKRGIDFKKTTLESWKRFIPSTQYRLREHDGEIIIADRVKFFIGGLDNQESINKFNSAEFAFIFIDQAEEINRTDLAMLKGTLRLTINNVQPVYKVLLTCNPAPCFIKQDYINQPKTNARFIQALPSDNPFLDPHYVNRLREAFKHRPELVEAYINGSWDDIEGSDILIKHSWILNIINKKLVNTNGSKVTSCDVARFGDDETVIYNMVDNKIVSEKIYGCKDAVYTAYQIVSMAQQNESDLIAIDGDGMGGPVVDIVKDILQKANSKISVLEIHSGKTPEDKEKYLNARAEMWFYASQQIAEGYCSIPNDQQLIAELSSLKYDPTTVAGGKFKIEPKADFKKRMDKSPDRADTFVYGLWATRKVAKSKYDFNRGFDFNERNSDGYGWDSVYAGDGIKQSVYSL